MKSFQIALKNEAATQQLGELFAAAMPRGILFLSGDLGAGKTCFSQALIRAAGFSGRVKSPTYTLVEPYELSERSIYHFDLYRLQDEEELLFLGCDEYFEAAVSGTVATSGAASLCLIEWPEKAASILPLPDIELRIEHLALPELGRLAHLNALSGFGEQVLNTLSVQIQNFH